MGRMPGALPPPPCGRRSRVQEGRALLIRERRAPLAASMPPGSAPPAAAASPTRVRRRRRPWRRRTGASASPPAPAPAPTASYRCHLLGSVGLGGACREPLRVGSARVVVARTARSATRGTTAAARRTATSGAPGTRMAVPYEEACKTLRGMFPQARSPHPPPKPHRDPVPYPAARTPRVAASDAGGRGDWFSGTPPPGSVQQCV